MRVLLVDDDRPYATELASRLELLGCEVIWVTNAEDCFHAANRDAPGIIVLASMVGTMSGLNICNALKLDPKLKPIPLLIMAKEPLSQLASHKELPTRADVYVKKTADMGGVLEEVRAMVGRGTQRLDMLLSVPLERVQECETLEVVAPAPDSVDPRVKAERLERELEAAQARVAQLEEDVQILERTAREQAAHIDALEAELERSKD